VGETWKPKDVAETAGAVKDALATGKTFELIGAGTRRSLGRPVQADVVLDLSALSGVRLYEPEELILVVAPGTPMSEIGQLLAKHNQHLAFEAPDYGRLWGQTSGAGTIGGAIMTGRNGPRRLTAGGARDYVLGVKGINGFGEPFACGGRVMKNVTGFDLPKLLTGSFGTLCAATEITLKTLPVPLAAKTLVFFDLSDDQAVPAIRKAMEISVLISAAAHLPEDIARLVSNQEISSRGQSATLLRLEGFGQAVESAVSALQELLGTKSSSLMLEETETALLWSDLTDASFFTGSDKPLWHLSVPPTLGAALGTRLKQELGGRHFYDWAGGALWFEASEAADGQAAAVRQILNQVVGEDGHATLIRASVETRRAVSPLQPLNPLLAALNDRVRKQFDPQRIFNPGRMYEAPHAN
jgi:glycolate dehydrogenase FAD-binding subunit